MTEQSPEPGTTEFSVFVCLFFNHFLITVTLKTLIKIEASKMNRTLFFTDVFFFQCVNKMRSVFWQTTNICRNTLIMYTVALKQFFIWLIIFNPLGRLL